MKLFDIEPKEEIKGMTCKDCKHRERLQCNSKVIQYCGVRKSNRTENGKLKIKCKNDACLSFEKQQI